MKKLQVEVVTTAGHTLPIPWGTEKLITKILKDATEGTDLCEGVYTFQLGAKMKGRPHMPAFKLMKFDRERFIRVKIKPGGNDTCHSGTIVPASGVSAKKLYNLLAKAQRRKFRSAGKPRETEAIEPVAEERDDVEAPSDDEATEIPEVLDREITIPPGLSFHQVPVYLKILELGPPGRPIDTTRLLSALRKENAGITLRGLGRTLGAMVRRGIVRSESRGGIQHFRVCIAVESQPRATTPNREISGDSSTVLALIISREAELARLEADLRNLEEKRGLLSEEIMKLRELQRQVSTD